MIQEAARTFIEDVLSRLGPGQCRNFEAEAFELAFPAGWMGAARCTSRERFLSSRVGAAYGVWTCDLLEYRRSYMVCRHDPKEGSPRVYVDPDRGYLFERLPSGELVQKDPEPAVRGFYWECNACGHEWILADNAPSEACPTCGGDHTEPRDTGEHDG